MVSPLYTLLLSLQDALGNCVTPELRAITFDVVKKKGGVFLWFFYDTEITWELEDHVSTLLVEVDTYSKELDMAGYEVIQLDSNKPIPVQGKFAYLRYEKILPKFERESHTFLLREKDYPHHAVFRLDMQQALLGRVTPPLRHVSVSADPVKKKLIAHFIYDGEISELNRQLATAAILDSRISLLDFEMRSFIERIDYPNEMRFHGQILAYCRQEWIFTNNGPIPSIRK
jgi:hypothetical protein